MRRKGAELFLTSVLIDTDVKTQTPRPSAPHFKCTFSTMANHTNFIRAGRMLCWTRAGWKWQQHSENLIYFFGLWRRLGYLILQYQTETAQPHLWHERAGLILPLQTCMSRKRQPRRHPPHLRCRWINHCAVR